MEQDAGQTMKSVAAFQVSTYFGFLLILITSLGTGEDIVRAALARTICEDISRRGVDDVEECVTEIFRERIQGMHAIPQKAP
jgi:hypothetical protein